MVMSKERELLQNILDQHEDDRFDIGSINHGKIRRLLAQPEQEPVLINPFFQKTYCADDMGYILEDFYERLNTDDCLITVDENNLTQGIFEVTINWREESIYIY